MPISILITCLFPQGGRVIGRAHLLSDGSHVQAVGGTLHLDQATSASESLLRHH